MSGELLTSEILGSDPSDWEYRVWYYSISHSVIHLRLEHKQLAYCYLSFLDVRYFEGPIGWRGGNITKATSNECKEILRIITPIESREEHSLSKLSEIYSLFLIESSGVTIKILAVSLHFSNSLSELKLPTNSPIK